MRCHLPNATHRRAFTLIELLVVIAIVGTLAAFLLPALARARDKARAMRCGGHLRQLALALQMYADDNHDHFPRSSHSAFVYGQAPWGRALAGYLGNTSTGWTNLFRGAYRCDGKTGSGQWSYGLNVYFELVPADDDYVGSPATWPRFGDVPNPTATILFAEVPGSVDHVMAHFWTAPADATDVAARRHAGRANHAFVDGHVELLRLAGTYAPATNHDQWNPSLAR